MNIFQIFKLIMGLFGWKPVDTVLQLPEPLKIVVKEIHNDNSKAMMVAKDEKKTALTIYVPSPDCKMDIIKTCLLIVAAWTLILGTARLVWLWMKKRLMSKRMGQEEENNVPHDLQACKGHAFFDCKSNKETEFIDLDEEKIIFFDFLSENDFKNDSTGVCFNLGSDMNEVFNLESQEKKESKETQSLESDEKNGILDFPVFPDLPSNKGEKLPNLKSKKKGFLNIPSDAERIPSLPTNEEEKFLSLEPDEKGFPDVPSDEKGSPELLSDEVELPLNLERFLDLSSDEQKFPTLECEEKDLPSDKEEGLLNLESKRKAVLDIPSDEESISSLSLYEEESFLPLEPEEKGLPDLASGEDSSDLLSDEMEFLLYLEQKKKRFPDWSSDEEERFPTWEYDDMTSNEQELFLYFKSKEEWFPDLPSDEERLPDFRFDKKVKLPLIESKEGLRDLPTIQEDFLDLPGIEEEIKVFPDLPLDEKMVLCLESKEENFPVRCPTKSYSIRSRPFKMKASSTRSSTLPYSKR